MKTILTLSALVALFAFAGDLEAAEPNQAPAKAKTPAVDSTNYPNYWDANAWDREGGASFWHAKEQKPAKKGLFSRAKAAKNGQAPQR